jgi:hypothetical protein
MAREGPFTTPGATLADLQAVYKDRLADAEVLFNSQRYASAIAMWFYALEICLKIAICRRLDLNELPKAFEIHDFQALLVVAGLRNRLGDPSAVLVKANWDNVTAYGPGHINELRYSPSASWGKGQAEDYRTRLLTDADGVLPWITAQ